MGQLFESMLLGPLRSKKGGKKIRNMGSLKIDQEDLLVIKALIEAGQVDLFGSSLVFEAALYGQEQDQAGKEGGDEREAGP